MTTPRPHLADWRDRYRLQSAVRHLKDAAADLEAILGHQPDGTATSDTIDAITGARDTLTSISDGITDSPAYKGENHDATA